MSMRVKGDGKPGAATSGTPGLRGRVQATCLPQGRITRCALTSYKVSLLAAVMAIQKQLREADGEASVYVADNGIYSESNMRQLNQAGVKWVSRVSETLTEAKTLLQEGSQTWQQSEDGTMHWFTRDMALPQGSERWVVVRTGSKPSSSSSPRRCCAGIARAYACSGGGSRGRQRPRGKPRCRQRRSR